MNKNCFTTKRCLFCKHRHCKGDVEPKSIENILDNHLYTSECKALWGEPEEVPSFANIAHMHAVAWIQTT